MTPTPAEIERIVAEVLADMGLSPPSPASNEETAGDWRIRQRVVTLACLPSQWDGLRRVVVPRGAVVTPAVRDELQRRGVPLACLAPAEADCPRGTVCLVTLGGSYDPAPLVRALEDDGWAVDSQRRDCLIAATDELAKDLAGGLAAAVLLTRHGAAAVCLANRHPGVRAIRAASADAVVADAEAVGANLLIVDPRAQGLCGVRQMVCQFLRGAPWPCPEVFRNRLA
ncbi:MAG: hypothetical protein NUV77_23825 [Thermoguttaceae bacterium]|jgi:hypothetical protein|nr:hypothetical protein [Thermoguttaceae bacterium]